jgi:hypothetical protein
MVKERESPGAIFGKQFEMREVFASRNMPKTGLAKRQGRD